ncbi:MAG: tRNA (N6-isopentenyl adenosine(37)-C2)-methylthiotransferase MiaB [Deltaproteobacteria bacterium]|nr:tRNA (N6-isopentenyl adenosine(37)-C2)-methylthiotransferase MiaB [Deltaproteobacteria bacterium]MBZ0219056.1 tRNA (N6-isopentenyl adenosine(37)-C2)-methylthiotransferase MiaB [Deltaproteobacteria bacterium]
MAEGLHGREKLVFLETFGCQMNENDSERMLGVLKGLSYTRTKDPSEADLILINTCSIRDKAEQKVYSILGRFKLLKKERPGLVIGVAGCVAQQEGERLLKRAPHLDIVFGPHNVHKLKELLLQADTGRKVVVTEQTGEISPEEYGIEPVELEEKAFVSIMRGCNNFCSYCIVPYTRGREVSRNSADILREIDGLVKKGVKEVTLLGQNVNSYGTGGGGDVSFPELLRKVCRVDGLSRVRFITSHPKDISDELIHLFGEEPKLCRHVHLPVQSGSDSVLSAMGRGYSVEEYLSKVGLLKKLYPDMAITTDIIVGFPGETGADYEATMGLLRTVRFDNIFSFMYSPRPGTRAAGLPDQFPLEVRSERLQRLQEEQKEITNEKMKALVGKTLEVLVEGGSKIDPTELSGRTSCNRIVNFPGSAGLQAGPGCLIEVTITEAYQNSLRGEVRAAGR